MKIRSDLAAELERTLKSGRGVCAEQARVMAIVRELRTKLAKQARRTEELREALPHIAASVQLGERPFEDLEAAKAELEQSRLEQMGAGDAASVLRQRLRPAEQKIRVLVIELAQIAERIAEDARQKMLAELGAVLSDVVGKIDDLGGMTDEGHPISRGVLANAPLLRALAPALEQAALIAAAMNGAGEFVEVAGRLLPASHPAAAAARAEADAAARAKLGADSPLSKGRGL